MSEAVSAAFLQAAKPKAKSTALRRRVFFILFF
jgi:hypothetical protein